MRAYDLVWLPAHFHSVLPACIWRHSLSASCCHVCCLLPFRCPVIMDSYLSGAIRQNKFFLILLLVLVFYHNNWKSKLRHSLYWSCDDSNFLASVPCVLELQAWVIIPSWFLRFLKLCYKSFWWLKCIVQLCVYVCVWLFSVLPFSVFPLDIDI